MPEHTTPITAFPRPEIPSPPLSRKGNAFRWYFVPLIVFLMGLLAMAQVFLLHLSIRHQRMNSTVVDTVMTIQIKAAVFHLRVEEFLSGGKGEDLKEAIDCMDEAIGLADQVRDLGADWQWWPVSYPTGDPAASGRAEEIKSLLVEFKQVGLQRMKQKRQTGHARIAHRRFDTLFNDLLAKAALLEESFKANRVQTRTKSWRLFSGIYLVWGGW